MSRFETLALHAGQTPDPTTKSRAVPIYHTTSYTFDDPAQAARLFNLEEFGNIYTRIMNPTTDVLEQRVAALEGGSMAMAAASGTSAELMAITNIVQAGDEIVAGSQLYGGTYNLFHHTLPKFGIRVKFVDSNDPEAFRAAISDKTKLFYGEAVGNPGLNTFPIAEVAAIGKENGIPLMIDNTLPTPYLIRPIEHGANIVVHSLTKFMGGHGTAIGGIVVDGGNFDWGSGRFACMTEPDPSYHGMQFWEVFADFPGLGNVAYAIKLRVQMLRDMGACISPFNAWSILQGIETLPVRMARHCENAQKVAEWLNDHPKVNWVNYPGLSSHADHDRAKSYHSGGFGAIIGFGIAGGNDAAVAAIEKMELFSLLANVGDAKSLVIHPASTTHRQLTPEQQATTGVTEDFIRLSIGIENVDDIIEDLAKAIG
jgi:O-acetylhomoserine (thiol)-lyase